MKRTIILATAATAMLTGCVKTEVNPVAVPEQEISYQTVVGPKTKATSSVLNPANKFVSYAFLLPAGKDWANDKAEAVDYIKGVTISKVNDVWRDPNNQWFWPNQGTLTFFAWSANSSSAQKPSNVTCDKANGITVESYNASSDNKNVDFMVADIQMNQKQNKEVGDAKGVPTYFKHKMCQVRYNIKTDHAYTYSEFYINSVTFINIYQSAKYQQFNVAGEWIFDGFAKTSQTYSSSSTNTVKLSNEQGYPDPTSWTPDGSDQFYFIPQTFSGDENGAKLEIEYSIKTNLGVLTTETKTATLFLNDTNLFGTTGWEANKIYTINITLGLNQIFWAPTVEEWETGTVGTAEGDTDWEIVAKNN